MEGFTLALKNSALPQLPLLPYGVQIIGDRRFAPSVILTFVALFAVGASRSAVTLDRWWSAGLEISLLGIVVAAAAYGSGALVAEMVASHM